MAFVLLLFSKQFIYTLNIHFFNLQKNFILFISPKTKSTLQKNQGLLLKFKNKK